MRSKINFLFGLVLFGIFCNSCVHPNSTYIRMKDFSGDFTLTEKTPLMFAAQVGDLPKVLDFIKKGADVNANNEISDLMTALHYAIANNHMDIAQALIDNGADVNALSDIMWSPIYYASSDGNLELASLLIKNGADVNLRDTEELSPLNYAVINNFDEVARLLIDNGAIAYANNSNAEYSEASAKCFMMLADKQLNEKVNISEVVKNLEMAAFHFEKASSQYNDKAYSALTKDIIITGSYVIMFAAVVYAASDLEKRMSNRSTGDIFIKNLYRQIVINRVERLTRKTDENSAPTMNVLYQDMAMHLRRQNPAMIEVMKKIGDEIILPKADDYRILKNYYFQLSRHCQDISIYCRSEAAKYTN